MPSQEYSVSIPIYMFRFLSILNLILPIGALIILWWSGSQTGHTLFSILAYLANNDPSFYFYALCFFLIAFVTWNIRLNISKTKIYYSVLNIPISWPNLRKEISHSQFNQKYDPPYTYIKRKLKHFDTLESEQRFNNRYGTIEFVLIQKSLFSTLRHKFALINFALFSNHHSADIVAALQQHWDLKPDI